MTDCPYCRKPIDPLASRCRHCGSAVQLTPGQPVETSFYSAVMAPALGAGLISFIAWVLSPFSGFALHLLLGGATDLTLSDYRVDSGSWVFIALFAMALSGLFGWLCYRRAGVALSLLSFFTPLVVPPVMIVGTQLAEITPAA
jgi:hypothetical protein